MYSNYQCDRDFTESDSLPWMFAAFRLSASFLILSFAVLGGANSPDVAHASKSVRSSAANLTYSANGRFYCLRYLDTCQTFTMAAAAKWSHGMDASYTDVLTPQNDAPDKSHSGEKRHAISFVKGVHETNSRT